jgi:hypothetical protein
VSLALSTARANVRRLIRDVDLSAPAVKGYIVDQAVSNHYQNVAARVNLPLKWTTITAVTAGTATYTTTTTEFAVIALFRLVTQNVLVEKVGANVLEPLRQQNTGRGVPEYLYVNEAPPATVGVTETTFTLYPAPSVSDTLEGLLSGVPLVLSADGDLIQLGQFAQRATEYQAAAELLASMTKDNADRLQIDKAATKYYGATAEQFIEWEQTRISRQRSGSGSNTSTHGRGW